MRNNYDHLLKAQMLSARKRMMEEAEKYYSDKFVTGKELTKLYPCFSTSWLRQNGCYLPRTRATLYDDEENYQNSKWGYSLNRIKQYIERGYVEINYKRYYFVSAELILSHKDRGADILPAGDYIDYELPYFGEGMTKFP